MIQIIPWSMILVITSRNRVFGAHRLKRCAPLLDSGSVATHTAKHAHHRGPAFQTAMSSRLTSMKGRSFGFVGAIRSLKHERKSFRTLPHSTRPQFDRAQGKSVRTIGLADDTGRRKDWGGEAYFFGHSGKPRRATRVLRWSRSIHHEPRARIVIPDEPSPGNCLSHGRPHGNSSDEARGVAAYGSFSTPSVSVSIAATAAPPPSAMRACRQNHGARELRVRNAGPIISSDINVLQCASQRTTVRMHSLYPPQAHFLTGATAAERPRIARRRNMATELKYPEWQMPFEDALLDSAKLVEVETVIRKRLRLLTGSGRLDEQRALKDALSTIRELKRDR